MKSSFSRPASYGSLHDDEARLRGEYMAAFIADVIQVRRAGDFVVVVAFPQHQTLDGFFMEVEARDKDGHALNVPYPTWEELPDWAMWWTASALGNVCIHVEKPELDYKGGIWWHPNNSKFAFRGGPIEIPLGVDWRTLCFERPLRKTLPQPSRSETYPQSAQVYEPISEAQPISWWRRFVP